MCSRSVVMVVFALSAISVAGCNSEDEKFSGLSDMVATRQQVRQDLSRDEARSNSGRRASNGLEKTDKTDTPATDLSSGILFEKQIEITDAQSKKTIARGVAYLDKQGRIVKIKVIKR